MAIFSTPAFQGAQAGIIGTASSTAASAQINQFLGTHTNTPIFQGKNILLPKYMYSPTSNPWNAPLINLDVDQPFTMTGTAIGRIQLPILPVGNGADLLVSLCQDSSGMPGSVITQTRIPATWINQLSCLSAPSGPASTFPGAQLTGNPLAVSQFQTWSFADQAILPYNYPAITFVGSSAFPAETQYGGYIVLVGGVSNSAALDGVYTMMYDAAGVLHPSVPQSKFPTTNDGSSASCVAIDAVSGSTIVVNTGGGTAYLGAPVASVYTATLDTTAGSLSTWAAQTSLPAAVQAHVMASWNGYVYSVGGKNSTGVLNTVNYAQVRNGQITSWTAATPLPVPMQLPFVAACNGYLVVAGGADGSYNAYSSVYYAVINANGSLGPWMPMPPLYSAAYNLNSNPYANSLGVIMTQGVNSMAFGTSGPGWSWAQDTAGGSGYFPGYYDFGDGSVLVYALAPSGNEYGVAYYNLVPYLSVPLPATGLTNGGTYHILLQQAGGNQANYLFTSVTATTYGASGPTALTSSPGAYSWTAQTTGNGVAIQAFDQSTIGTPVHTWEDSGARISTFVYATTPDQRLLGLCEATRTVAQRNSNSGFESGLSPWTVSGGTYAQSTTHVKEGAYACQITPSGSASTVYIQSEKIACWPGQAITVTGWLWFTSAVTSNASLNINWYTVSGTYISTSSNAVSVSAGAWTQLTNTFTAPSTAYFYAIDPTLTGTPAASQIWYADQVYSTDQLTVQQSSVVQVEYPGTYPSGTFPPTGVVGLA